MLLLGLSHVLVTVLLTIFITTTFTSGEPGFLHALLTLSHVLPASSAPRPIKRISHPSTLAIEIYPRRLSHSSIHHARAIPPDTIMLHHSDFFRLTLSAFGETFHLHLRPNDHLIHSSARIVYYDTNAAGQSVLSRTEPLLPSSIKAYWGEVIPTYASADRMRADAARAPYHPGDALGWARITVHDQGDAGAGRPPVFEGAFSVRGTTYHVATRDSYLRNRGPLDPDPHLHPSESDGSNPDLDIDLDRGLIIWRDSDVMNPWEESVARMGIPVDHMLERRSLSSEMEPVRCGHDALPWNSDPMLNPVLRQPGSSSWYDPFGLIEGGSTFAELLMKRDDIAGSGMSTNFANTIGQIDGCSKEQKVLYMGVAADCEYVNRYGSQANATRQILSIWNTASVLYKDTFNVSLGIVELQIQNTTCPTVADPAVPWNVNCSTPNVNLDDRLSLFSKWRGIKGNDGAGLWHLMSNCPTGSEVGIAWLATLCQVNATGSGSSIVSGTAVSTAGLTEWQVISHEMGHNFGAIHDCAGGCNSTSACCPLSTNSCDASSKFLMSPVASRGEMNFSQCSIGNICSLMKGSRGGKVDTSCLMSPDPSRQTISLQMCGNGIVESGEDCDPGKGSNSTCCDPDTCKFRNNAVCDPSSAPCCTAQCQFAPSTQVCRAARDATCDTAEMCTGNSSACPPDSFAPNGKSCGSGGLACATGQCTSIAQQCKQLGASMNLQEACPSRNDQSCKVSCQDPTTLNQCVLLDSLLIDGSPCGYGGTCLKGTCQSGSLFDTAKAWYVQNLQISIPITITAALLAVTILWGLISTPILCCSKHDTQRRRL
ncbi:Metallo-peptidase family M12-domain-containing protein [Multifurca ochricompacta]|uniref:Disintegrin and metalloproteinase domain-containing protein B n=1 Tax=Multifurca ochricompacta TaxID=376703 RepID=A0AAD4QRD3_9AGAM|nr:Metallo-peptidase family M12-domain-containing protein [Multifurca ochricompacta]